MHPRHPMDFPTGAHTTSYRLPIPKPPRPPIHNPYDKFTQTEFDAWIGGITGALKRALGQEAEDVGKHTQNLQQDPAGGRGAQYQALDESGREQPESDVDDGEFNDSFAEIKARRHAVGKGKQRDPREGPGFAKDQPIELSDDEQGEDPAYTLEEMDNQVRSRNARSHDEHADQREEEEDQFDAELEEDLERDSPEADEIIEVSDEDEGYDENIPPPAADDDEEYSEREYSSEGDGDILQLTTKRPVPPSSFHEARPASGHSPQPNPDLEYVDDNSDVEEIDSLEEDEDNSGDEDHIQPLEEDIAFPPHSAAPSITLTQPIDIPNPWTGPETYAEDYYSGGDAPLLRGAGTQLGAGRLGEGDEYDTGGDYQIDGSFYGKEVGVDFVVEDGDDIGSFLTPGVGTPAGNLEEGDEVVDKLTPEDVEERIQGLFVLPASSPMLSSPIDATFSTRPPPYQDGDAAQRALDGLYDDMEVDTSRELGLISNHHDGGEGLTDKDSTSSHFDWKFPPAFPESMHSSAPGHLVPLPRRAGRVVKLVEEEEEEEEDGLDGINAGAFPLGTSDLDIFQGRHGRDDGDDQDGREEGEGLDTIQEDAFDEDPSLHPDNEPEVPAQREHFQHDDIELQYPEVESDTEKGSQQREQDQDSDFGLLPTPPPLDGDGDGERRTSVVPGQQELDDILDSLFQGERGEVGAEHRKEEAVEREEKVADIGTVADAGGRNIPAGASEVEADTLIPTVSEIGKKQEEGYTVTEPKAEEEEEFSDGDNDFNVTIVVVEPDTEAYSGGETEEEQNRRCVIEEPLTETEEQLTEEPGGRAMSIGVVSVDARDAGKEEVLPTLERADIEVFAESAVQVEVLEVDDEPLVDEIAVEVDGTAPDAPEITDIMVEVDLLELGQDLGLEYFDPASVEVVTPETVEVPYTADANTSLERVTIEELQVEQDINGRTVSPELVDTCPDGTEHSIPSDATQTKGHLAMDGHKETSLLDHAELPSQIIQTIHDAISTDAPPPHVPSSSSSGHPRNAFPMPISADPSVPDPTSRPHTPLSRGTLILSVPGTPSSVLGPVGTPGAGGRPTPNSVPVHASVLRALQVHQPKPWASSGSGLFTPAAGGSSESATPERMSSRAESDETIAAVGSGQEFQQVDDDDDRLGRQEEAEIVAPDAQSMLAEMEPTEQTIGEPSLRAEVSSAPVVETAAVEAPHVEDDPYTITRTMPGAIPGLPERSNVIDRVDPPGGEDPQFKPPLPSRTPAIPYSTKVVMTRKSTDPILFADPYPYSLSTPGPPDSDENAKEEASEEETEQEQDTSASSSSTVEKDLEEHQGGHMLGRLGGANDPEDPNLKTPPEIITSQERSATARPSAADPVYNDTDADGELDPDFIHLHPATQPTHSQSEADPETEVDPFKLMGTHSTVAPGAVDVDSDASSSGGNDEVQTPVEVVSVPEGVVGPDTVDVDSNASSSEDKDESEVSASQIPKEAMSLPRRLITPEEVVEVNSDASSSGDKDEVETSIGQASKSEKSLPPSPLPAAAEVSEEAASPTERPVNTGQSTGAAGRQETPTEKGDDPFSSDEKGSSTVSLGPESTSSRPSKRKRASSVNISSRVTRSGSIKKPAGSSVGNIKDSTNTNGDDKTRRKTKGISAARSKGKGKGKDKETLSRQGSEKPSESGESWTSSGVSTAYRMLRASRNNSRASSIASTAASDRSSIIIPPSPTVTKQNNGIMRPQAAPPPPLFHAHNHTLPHHHHHPPPSMAAQQQLQRQMHKPAQTARLTEPLTTAEHSPPQPSSSPTSSQPGPSQSRSGPSSGSPVTRSNCRYHKISLPREEGGPRVCFLVPGCSLGDKELLDEEEIEDHGDATHEDSLRIIRDVESLDFSSYLIGVLRKLVGVDLLREQEVYYLPRPGEEPTLKARPRRPTVDKSASTRAPHRESAANAESVSNFGSPRTSISMRSIASPKAPLSGASTSTSTSAFRLSRPDKESFSSFSDAERELSDDEIPKTKRPRAVSPEVKGDVGAMGPPGPESQSSNRLRPRRSRRLGKDAAAYKPDTDAEGDSGDDAQKPTRTRHKRGTKQGVKRTRTTEDEDVENRNSKKSRTRVGEQA